MFPHTTSIDADFPVHGGEIIPRVSGSAWEAVPSVRWTVSGVQGNISPKYASCIRYLFCGEYETRFQVSLHYYGTGGSTRPARNHYHTSAGWRRLSVP
jgi:hypothetical protein